MGGMLLRLNLNKSRSVSVRIVRFSLGSLGFRSVSPWREISRIRTLGPLGRGVFVLFLSVLLAIESASFMLEGVAIDTATTSPATTLTIRFS